MVFHKESLEQIDNHTKNKNYERVNIIRRKRSYEFDMVTLTKVLYMTTGQALTIYKYIIQIICSLKNKLRFKHQFSIGNHLQEVTEIILANDWSQFCSV